MKLTSDKRYIVSVSNKFITFDVVTSDLARQVYPKVKFGSTSYLDGRSDALFFVRGSLNDGNFLTF
jgi:hypothetical protein